MTQEFQLRILPEIAANEQKLKEYLFKEKGLNLRDITATRILKRSIDARQRTIFVNLKVRAYIKEMPQEDEYERTIYNKVEEKLTRKVLENAEDEISWRQGEFIFDDLPLQEIARELSNSFGATIQIADTTLQNYRITARFRDGEDLATILSVLHNAGYFNYSQNNKQIIITAKPD